MEKKRKISYKWLALITVSIGTYMSTLDASIVNISFPRLTTVFDTEPSIVLWVSVAYLLVSVSLVFAFGKLGDFWGRKKIYTLGFAIFTIGLILCTFSQSIMQLILARVVQAIGASMTVALGTAIITAVFPPQERGKAIGISGATVSAGLLSGPVIGGFLVDLFDWQAIFYVTIPVALIGMVMAIVCLKEQKVAEGKFNFDWRGAVTLSLGLACLLLFFNLGGKQSFSEIEVVAFGIMSLVLIVAFVIIERKTTNPVLDLKLFRNRLFAAGNISLLIMFVALSANTLLMPFYLIEGLEYTASQSGLLFASVSITALVIGPLSGWLSDKIGYRLLCTVGIALMSGGLFWISRLGEDATLTDIVPRLAIMGIGSGLFSSPNNSSIMGSVPWEKLSTGSAMIATVRQVGMSSGIAIAGAIFTSREAAHIVRLTAMSDPVTLDINRTAMIYSYQDTMLVATIVCALAVFASFSRGNARPQATKPPFAVEK
jgi:EmrB/QacA subfamily drug resistance transporter